MAFGSLAAAAAVVVAMFALWLDELASWYASGLPAGYFDEGFFFEVVFAPIIVIIVNAPFASIAGACVGLVAAAVQRDLKGSQT